MLTFARIATKPVVFQMLSGLSLQAFLDLLPAFWSLYLQTSTLPQPMDAFAIDGTFAPQQRRVPSG